MGGEIMEDVPRTKSVTYECDQGHLFIHSEKL